jgi:hypothetical protein
VNIYFFGLSILPLLRGLYFSYSNIKPYFLDSSLQAKFPANTNILYVDLASAELVGSSKNENSLPGMVLNTKKAVAYICR